MVVERAGGFFQRFVPLFLKITTPTACPHHKHFSIVSVSDRRQFFLPSLFNIIKSSILIYLC